MRLLGKEWKLDANPKRSTRGELWDGLFPYYAGFSEDFALNTLQQLDADRTLIWDPFNGSGTTTFAAQKLGLRSFGSDINPVMVMAAQARSFPRSELASLRPIAAEIVRNARNEVAAPSESDPLLAWFSEEEVSCFRAVFASITKVTADAQQPFSDSGYINWSCLTSLLVICLFSSMRRVLADLKGSNPTWLPKSADTATRKLHSTDDLLKLYVAVISSAHAFMSTYGQERHECGPALFLASCEDVSPLPRKPNFVFTSPPYLTRIDYAVSTRIELALIEDLTDCKTSTLRSEMMGTTISPKREIPSKRAWGEHCAMLLKKIRTHPSKASSTYYYGTYADYFDKYFRSLTSVAEAIERRSGILLVLQDSFYKEIHVDLQSITIEMLAGLGFELEDQKDFSARSSMAFANPKSNYRLSKKAPTESVLAFSRA